VFGEASQYLGIKPQRLWHFCFWSKNLSSISTINWSKYGTNMARDAGTSVGQKKSWGQCKLIKNKKILTNYQAR